MLQGQTRSGDAGFIKQEATESRGAVTAQLGVWNDRDGCELVGDDWNSPLQRFRCGGRSRSRLSWRGLGWPRLSRSRACRRASDWTCDSDVNLRQCRLRA